MTKYVRRTYYYNGDGFETDDKIVEILSHNSTKGRLTALVIPDEDIPTEFEGSKSQFFCNKETDSGGFCEREVSGPEERCWQHE